jgi:hypothetical protein
MLEAEESMVEEIEEPEETEEARPELSDLQQEWNNFVSCFVKAEEIWETKLKDVLSSKIAIDGQGIPKIYASYRLSKFIHLLPRIVMYARGVGGIKELFTKI